jgi:WhiB family redox-sensing transcriptional regulator
MKLDIGFLPPEWVKQARCAEVDPVIFFPEKGERTSHAKAVCRSCEVKAECLQYSLDNNEKFGIWGGLTELDRIKLYKRKKAS